MSRLSAGLWNERRPALGGPSRACHRRAGCWRKGPRDAETTGENAERLRSDGGGCQNPDPRSNRSWRPRADATSLVTATRPLWLVGLRRLYHYSMFVLLVGAVIALATLLDTDGKVVALKIFVIAYFSLLPAILYLQFTSRKTPTVWREYVLTLFRLHADDYAYLPEPPKPSRYPWGA